METIFTLPGKQAFLCKLWPALITLCGIYLIWAFDASIFSILIALVATVFAWWRSAYVPHTITLRNDGTLLFESLLKKIEITADDIHAIVENNRYKEYSLRHRNGAIAVSMGMPNVTELIRAIKEKNPTVQVRSATFDRAFK